MANRRGGRGSARRQDPRGQARADRELERMMRSGGAMRNANRQVRRDVMNRLRSGGRVSERELRAVLGRSGTFTMRRGKRVKGPGLFGKNGRPNMRAIRAYAAKGGSGD